MTRRSAFARIRAAILAVVLGATSFVVAATPVAQPIADELGITPESAQAAYCGSGPEFTGRLTGSATSTTALTKTTTGNVYGYISGVNSAWSCTLYYRYSAIAWNTSASLGTFDWGALIHSTGMACNWVVGSPDYLKANDTADCPDTDAEYAMTVTLSPEATYVAQVNHT